MLARLHEVGSRLWLERDLHQALDEILAGAIALLGATSRAWCSPYVPPSFNPEIRKVFKVGCLLGFGV
jgi:hypothetical protein